MAAPARTRSRTALRLKLPCDFTQVRRIAQAVSDFLRQQQWNDEQILDCELALVEACNNAIKYASPVGRRLPVLVQANCSPNDLELRVTDHTAGFSWPQVVALPGPEHESGRGLYLIQAVMDEVDYVRGRGHNTLLMRRHRRG